MGERVAAAMEAAALAAEQAEKRLRAAEVDAAARLDAISQVAEERVAAAEAEGAAVIQAGLAAARTSEAAANRRANDACEQSATAEAERAATAAQLAAVKASCNEARAELNDRTVEVARLLEGIGREQQRVAGLENRLANAEAEIGKLKSGETVAKLRGKLAAQANQLDSLVNEARAMHIAVNQKEVSVRSLRALLHDLHTQAGQSLRALLVDADDTHEHDNLPYHHPGLATHPNAATIHPVPPCVDQRYSQPYAQPPYTTCHQPKKTDAPSVHHRCSTAEHPSPQTDTAAQEEATATIGAPEAGSGGRPLQVDMQRRAASIAACHVQGCERPSSKARTAHGATQSAAQSASRSHPPTQLPQLPQRNPSVTTALTSPPPRLSAAPIPQRMMSSRGGWGDEADPKAPVTTSATASQPALSAMGPGVVPAECERAGLPPLALPSLRVSASVPVLRGLARIERGTRRASSINSTAGLPYGRPC